MRLSDLNWQKLCVILGAPFLLLTGCNSAIDRVLEESFERLYTIEPTANITIQNGDGAVMVYGSNVNEMRVDAVKKAYSRARLTQIAIDVTTKPGSVSITTKFPPKPKWGLFDRSGTVDYTIVVPATATVSGLELDAGMIGGRKAGSPLRQMSPRETHGYIFPATPLSISLPKQHREKSAMILKVPQLLNQQRLPVRMRTHWCTVATMSESTYG